MMDRRMQTALFLCVVMIFGGAVSAGAATSTLPVDANGNVGIGTTVPGYKLEVNGSLNATSLYVNGTVVSTSQWTTSSSDIYFNTGNVGIGTTTPRSALWVFNDHTGTGDLPGSVGSRSVALVLQSDATAADSRPGIVQYGLRTAGSGIAYSINTAYIGSNESNVVRAVTMGVLGTVGVSTHSVAYAYLDSRADGTYNNATLKIDNNNRVGVALTGETRPVSALDVAGGMSIGAYAGVDAAPSNGLIISGNVGISTTSPRQVLDVGSGKITGGTYSATANRAILDLSANNHATNGGASFFYNQGGRFNIYEWTIKGTDDIFFQATPATASGYGFLEAWTSAGLVVGTGGNTAPILFQINRVEKMRVDSQGNVGIGTTAPVALLNVVDASNTAAVFSLTNNTATTLGNGANTLGILDLQSTSMTTGNFLNMELNAMTSGKGINLTSTSTAFTGDLASLTASGSNAAVTGSVLKVGLTGANATGTALNVTTGATSGFALRVNDDGTYTDTSAFVVLTDGNVGVGTAVPIGLFDVNRKLTVLSGGNVGIGSVVPSQALDVAGNIKVSQGVEITSAPSADQTIGGFYATFMAGEDLVFGNVVYIKSDEKAWKANAGNESTVPVVAMAMGSISTNATGKFLLLGLVRNDAWTWTVGGKVYLDTTSGALTQTPPTGTDKVVQIIGIATHADRMFFNPERVYVTLN